jgi:acyl-CoA thioesterase
VTSVGDLDADTRLSGGEGSYTAVLSPDWKIWGPNGGYVAAIALRAAGLESRLARPASFSCQFLEAGAFEPAQVRVEALRRGKAAEAFGVSLEQSGRRLLTASVWTVGKLAGLEHDTSAAPSVPSPEDLLPVEKLLAGIEAPAPHPFWGNLERRPIDWVAPQERVPTEPIVRCWYRFRPQPRFQDPFLDAARCLILLDTMSWPAVRAAYVEQPAWLAPSLDVSAQFHALAPESDWLLCETSAEIAREGLIGYRSRVWSEDRHLLASGGGQLLCRPAPDGVRR